MTKSLPSLVVQLTALFESYVYYFVQSESQVLFSDVVHDSLCLIHQGVMLLSVDFQSPKHIIL